MEYQRNTYLMSEKNALANIHKTLGYGLASIVGTILLAVMLLSSIVYMITTWPVAP